MCASQGMLNRFVRIELAGDRRLIEEHFSVEELASCHVAELGSNADGKPWGSSGAAPWNSSMFEDSRLGCRTPHSVTPTWISWAGRAEGCSTQGS